MTNVRFHKEKNGQHYFMKLDGIGTYREQDFVSVMNTYLSKLNTYDGRITISTSTCDGLSDTTKPFVGLSTGEKSLVNLVTDLHNKRFEE